MTVIKRFVDLSVIDRSWLVQESPGLNPDWFWGIKLFSVKTLNIIS